MKLQIFNMKKQLYMKNTARQLRMHNQKSSTSQNLVAECVHTLCLYTTLVVLNVIQHVSPFCIDEGGGSLKMFLEMLYEHDGIWQKIL